ncbi:hypothetical protein OIV83_004521 [Microbotryomycetes sp. JL201]|nr:hypothetical protein OIV83_004521 [Microbotryomycetes sp. JL201]
MYTNPYSFTGGHSQQQLQDTFKQPSLPAYHRPTTLSAFNVVAPPRRSTLSRSSIDAAALAPADSTGLPDLVPDSPRSSLSSASSPPLAHPPPPPLDSALGATRASLADLNHAWPAYQSLAALSSGSYAGMDARGPSASPARATAFERASSVPVQTLPKPIRRRTQEWKDQQTFVPSYYGSQHAPADAVALAAAATTALPSSTLPAGATGYTPLQQQQLLQQYQQQLQNQQQQLLWAPSTDHPLSLPEQQDLLDRVRRDLNGVDLDTIKGPLRALALAPQNDNDLAATANSVYASSQPAYGSQQAVEREREEMLRKTVSPQEAFLDYDDVDHRLSHSSPRSLGASLFAPLPHRTSPVLTHQLQPPRTPPLVATVKSTTKSPRASTNGSTVASTSTAVAPTSPSATGAAGLLTSPRSSARKAQHPFAVPENAISWLERTTSNGNLATGDDMADFEKGGSSSDDPDDDGPDDDVDDKGVFGGRDGGGGKTKADGSVVHPDKQRARSLSLPNDEVTESDLRTKTTQINLSALPPLINDGAATLARDEAEQETTGAEADQDAPFGLEGSDPLLADRYEVPPPPKSADMTPAFGFAPPPPPGAAGSGQIETAAEHAVYTNGQSDGEAQGGDGYVSARIPRPKRDRTTSKDADADAEGEYYYFDNDQNSSDDYYGAPPPPPHVIRRASGGGGGVRRKRSRTPGFGASSDEDGTFQDDDDDDAWGSDFGSRRRKSGVDKNGAPNKRRRRAPNKRQPGDPDAPGGIACPHVNKDGSVCGTVFRRPYDLARHRETIHNEGIKTGKKVEWTCKECGGSFSRKDALIRHARIRNHRSGL